MVQPKEFGKNVTLSIGALLLFGMLIFWGTKFYLTQNTLEHRIEKKYDRLDERIKEIETKIFNCG